MQVQGGTPSAASPRAGVIRMVILAALLLVLLVVGFYLGRPIYWRIASEEQELYAASARAGTETVLAATRAAAPAGEGLAVLADAPVAAVR